MKVRIRRKKSHWLLEWQPLNGEKTHRDRWRNVHYDNIFVEDLAFQRLLFNGMYHGKTLTVEGEHFPLSRQLCIESMLEEKQETSSRPLITEILSGNTSPQLTDGMTARMQASRQPAGGFLTADQNLAKMLGAVIAEGIREAARQIGQKT